MSDPVASKSTFLCMYMSNHPDTLVSYVKFYGGINEEISTAEMMSIDTKGMMLGYKSKQGGPTKKEVHIPFDPPLLGYEEVKPRLLTMKADAEEALGMMRAPQITSFHFPRRAMQHTVPMWLLAYTTFAPANDSLLFTPANALRSLIGGMTTMKYIWIFIGVAHIFESLYTYYLCRKHRTPFTVGALYVLTTAIWGFPIWVDMRKRIQTARIESIMKGQ